MKAFNVCNDKLQLHKISGEEYQKKVGVSSYTLNIWIITNTSKYYNLFEFLVVCCQMRDASSQSGKERCMIILMVFRKIRISSTANPCVLYLHYHNS